MDFFSSPAGVAIAWCCTVVGFFYAIFTTNKIYQMKTKINDLNIQLSLVNSQRSETNQFGRNNTSVGSNSGSVKIEMK